MRSHPRGRRMDRVVESAKVSIGHLVTERQCPLEHGIAEREGLDAHDESRLRQIACKDDEVGPQHDDAG